MGCYDTALVCKNGHLVNNKYHGKPEDNANYCKECGEKTISICEECQAEIRGQRISDGKTFVFPMHEVPKYCYNCGKAYPWTESKLNALDEIIELMDDLNYEDKKTLKDSSRDIMTDNPRTELGVLKMKKLLGKTGEGAWNLIKDIIIQIASETAINVMKKQGML